MPQNCNPITFKVKTSTSLAIILNMHHYSACWYFKNTIIIAGKVWRLGERNFGEFGESYVPIYNHTGLPIPIVVMSFLLAHQDYGTDKM